MYKSFSMELAGRTLTVDVGQSWQNRQTVQHLCIMVIQPLLIYRNRI